MANEVTVIELSGLTGANGLRKVPPLAVQTLSIAGAVSTAFKGGTVAVSIHTSVACKIEFTKLDGTVPDGAGAGSGVIPLPAGAYHDFEVRSGDQVIAVA